MSPKQYFAASFGLTFLLFGITYLTSGFYFEEIEGFFDAMLTGKLSPGVVFNSWYYMAHIGVSYLYAALYQFVPGVEWMSWILYTYMWLACSILLYWVGTLLLAKGYNAVTVLLIQIAFYVIVMMDNVVNFQWTRISCFVCAAALLSIVFAFKDVQVLRSRWGLFVLLNLFFVVGTLTRLECSMAVCFFTGAFALYYQNNFWHTVRMFVFPVSFVLLVLGWIIYDAKHSDKFYKQVEPDIETQITMRANFIPLSAMKTKRDSIRYEAGINLIWGDPHVVTVPFLRSLLKSDSKFFADPTQWQRTRYVIMQLVREHKGLVVYNMLLMLLGLLLTLKYASKKDGALLVLYWLSFFMLIVLQTYFVKINERSFMPTLALFTFMNMLIALLQLSRDLRWPLAWITFAAIAYQGIFISNSTQIMRSEWHNHHQNLQKIKQIAGGEILVLNTSTIRYFSFINKPFEPLDVSAFDKLYINEAQVLPTITAYRNYLEKECQCDVNNFSNFFRYLQQVKNKKVYFLTDVPRMKLISAYLQEIYKLELPLQEVPIKFEEIYTHERSDIMDLKLYTLKQSE